MTGKELVMQIIEADALDSIIRIPIEDDKALFPFRSKVGQFSNGKPTIFDIFHTGPQDKEFDK
ncbi:MAG: hypothetical protein KAS32_16740 [Candidatus Peribacteraceae bacterium]|nr:hypothetical protein [Candidatus Peribacteraceae bacterium]